MSAKFTVLAAPCLWWRKGRGLGDTSSGTGLDYLLLDIEQLLAFLPERSTENSKGLESTMSWLFKTAATEYSPAHSAEPQEQGAKALWSGRKGEARKSEQRIKHPEEILRTTISRVEIHKGASIDSSHNAERRLKEERGERARDRTLTTKKTQKTKEKLESNMKPGSDDMSEQRSATNCHPPPPTTPIKLACLP